jgi:hypothetical protein
MLRPSGCIDGTTFAPRRLNRSGASAELAPFAQSITIFNLRRSKPRRSRLKEREVFLLKFVFLFRRRRFRI